MKKPQEIVDAILTEKDGMTTGIAELMLLAVYREGSELMDAMRSVKIETALDGGLIMRCASCRTVLCEVEAGDSMQTLLTTASDHKVHSCQRPPWHQAQVHDVWEIREEYTSHPRPLQVLIDGDNQKRFYTWQDEHRGIPLDDPTIVAGRLLWRDESLD